MQNVLIIHAHQFYEGISTGKLNASMAHVVQQEMEQRGYTVQHTYIEQGYAVADEVAKHLWADLIILQSPVYWFGMPWIYKKYVDEVFTAGMLQGSFITGDGRTRADPTRQYGSGGLLQGKQYMVSLTWNAPQEAFDNPAQALFKGKSVDDVLVANNVMENVASPVTLWTKPGNTVGKVTVSGLDATGVYRSGFSAESWADEPITNVVVRNARIELTGGGKAWTASQTARGPGVDARPLPAWGLYARHVQSLTLEDVRFSLTADDARPVVHADLVERLALDNIKFPRVPGVTNFIVTTNVGKLFFPQVTDTSR